MDCDSLVLAVHVLNCANIWFILSGLAVEVPDCRDWKELMESVKMATSGTLLFIDHSRARSIAISSFV